MGAITTLKQLTYKLDKTQRLFDVVEAAEESLRITEYRVKDIKPAILDAYAALHNRKTTTSDNRITANIIIGGRMIFLHSSPLDEETPVVESCGTVSVEGESNG